MTTDTKSLEDMIPVLTFPPREPDAVVSMGIEGLLLDGKPFPYALLNPCTVEMGSDRVTTLTVTIAVKLGEVIR